MNFVKKINKYLLENYPTIWNTRLVWMLGIGMLTHILFFVLGYLAVHNQADVILEHNLSKFYFDRSTVFFNMLLSVIILLIWIIYYIQNNAFKNFYKLKKGTLLLHFFIVVGIVFINISQYSSFYLGIKLKVRNMYDWEEVDADIKELNRAGVFLIKNKSDYQIDNKKYPKPFPLKYSNTEHLYKNIYVDTTKGYIKHKEDYYQFYEIDTALFNKDQKEIENLEKVKGSVTIEVEKAFDAVTEQATDFEKSINSNDFKYRIVKDVSAYKEDIDYCLLNYSSTLFNTGQTPKDYEERIKYFEALFNRADEDEIKQKLSSFLNLAKKYKIKNNLNVEEWYGLLNENNYTYERALVEDSKNSYDIYEIRKIEKPRKNYNIKQFILSNETIGLEKERFDYTKKVEVSNRIIVQEEKVVYNNYKDKYYPTVYRDPFKLYSNYKDVSLSIIPYCNLNLTDQLFDNIHEAYFKKIDKEIIYMMICCSIIMSLLLLVFKVTDVKTILLSIVAGAVIIIITAIISEYFPKSYKEYWSNRIIEGTIFLTASFSIITTSILAFKFKWRKIITSILFSLGLFAIPFVFIFLMELYRASMDYEVRNEDYLYQLIKKFSFYVVMIIWLIGIVLYTKAIRKWKGLPE